MYRSLKWSRVIKDPEVELTSKFVSKYSPGGGGMHPGRAVVHAQRVFRVRRPLQLPSQQRANQQQHQQQQQQRQHDRQRQQQQGPLQQRVRLGVASRVVAKHVGDVVVDVDVCFVDQVSDTLPEEL